MRRLSLLALSLVLIGCHKAPPFRIDVPPLATLRSYVPEDMRPLPLPDPKDDGRLVMEKSFDPPKGNLTKDYPTLESVRANPRQCAEQLSKWKPCLDAAIEASKKTEWSPWPSTDKDLTVEGMELGPDLGFENWAKVKAIAKSLVCRARLETAKNDARSGATYGAVVRLGSALEAGRGPQIAYIVGIAVTAIGDRAIQRDAPSISTQGLKDILRLLPNPETISKGLASTTRAELDFSIRTLQFAGTMTKGGSKGSDAATEALADNPHPFDAKETVELMAAQARHRADIEAGPYWQSISQAEKLEKDADEDLSAAFGDSMPSISGPESTSAPESARPQTLTAKQRTALQTMPNVVGRALASFTGSLPFADMVKGSAKSQADLSATRLIVALQLYKRTYGGFPVTLQALVDKGILKSIPQDPFDGKQFRYDPKRAIVWSVWFDMKDQGGHTAPFMLRKKLPPGSPGMGDDVDDVVWPIDGHTDAR